MGSRIQRQRFDATEENHERWVISYADFVTLLFAFFVVMYSISSVNEGKYRVLSDSLVTVFNKKQDDGGARNVDPINLDPGTATDRMVELPMPGDYPGVEDYKYSIEGIFDDAKHESPDVPQAEQELAELSDELGLAFNSLISSDLATVKSTKDWVEIDIKSKVLFSSGRASLNPEANEVLQKITAILNKYSNPVSVEGYTDNQPISTPQFPSNWELSSARAAAVVRALITQGLAASRLAAVGYAEYHPIAPNDTAEGRATNRRVSLIITKRPDPDMTLDTAAPEEDYKLGAVPSTNEPEIGADPQSRINATTQQSTRIPLKIIKLENGGLLFSNEPRAPIQEAP